MDVAVLLVLLLPVAITAEVTLVSSVEQEGRTAACPGELVTFTCTVTQGVSLNWASTAFTSCDSTPTYTLEVNTSVGRTSVCGSFLANLTAITNITRVGQSLSADLTSTLSPTTSVSPGTVITCSDLIIPQRSPQSKQYPNAASLPSSPQNPASTVQYYGPQNITVVVQWGYPQSDGGAPVVNHTVTLMGPGIVNLSTTSVQAMATFTLAYNEEYTVSIAATNCAGTGGTVSLNISEAGCGGPTPPMNGSIVEFVRAAVGSQIHYRCDPGFLPEGLMTSTCASSMNWSPNPADLTCMEPANCLDPQPPMNGSIEDYTSTVEDSVVVFYCNEGLTPEGQMTATCALNGSWTPNPADLVCMEPSPDDQRGQLSLGVQVAIAVCCVILLVVAFVVIVIAFLCWRKHSGVALKNPDASDCHQLRSPTLDEFTETAVKSQEGTTDCDDVQQSRNTDQTTFIAAEYSTVGQTSEKPRVSGRLMYADLGPQVQAPVRPPSTGDSVQYSSLLHGEAVQAPLDPADKSLNLDNLLIQLQHVDITKWRQLGEALGVPKRRLNDITYHHSADPEQCKVEVLDQWLRSRTRPTWREVADALTQIHESELANSLREVYTTGILPVTVDMRSLPRSALGGESPPPPLPPKQFSYDDPIPLLECHEPPQDVPPPRPPKAEHNKPPPKPTAPPRPPKSHQRGSTPDAPPRPPKPGQF